MAATSRKTSEKLNPTEIAGLGSMADRALHAISWRFVGTILQICAHLLAGIILARLLSPEAFGIVGMALVIIGLGKLVEDLGFGVAIIQRPTLAPTHLRAAFTACLLTGIFLFMLIWFLAPTISYLYIRENSLTPLLRAIALSFIFSGMSSSSVCFLRRQLRFRTLAFIESISYVTAYFAVGIPLAALGYGVWSLVIANLIQALILMVLVLNETRQSILPYFGIKEYRDLLSTGSAELMNNVINYISANMDFFTVGKWLGASALGLYSRAFYLMALPVRHFAGTLSSALFPLYSKFQGEGLQLGKAYLRTISITSIIAMPVLFSMAAVPEVIIKGLYGTKWTAAAGALQILSVSGPFWVVLRVSGALTHARGYIINECRRQGFSLAVMAVSLWLLLPYGLEGAALAVAFSTFVRYLLLAHLSIKLADVGWGEFFFAQLPGCILGAIVAAIAYLTSLTVAGSNIHDVVQLLITAVGSILTLTVALLLLPTRCSGDLYKWVSNQFGARLPAWLGRIIATKAAAQ